MKLGLWNRLAIVVTAITCPVAASWFVLNETNKLEQTREAFNKVCMDQADFYRKANDIGRYLTEQQKCWDERFLTRQWNPGWTEWWYAFGAVAALCALMYAIIFACIWAGKWVWRGRSVNKNTETA